MHGIRTRLETVLETAPEPLGPSTPTQLNLDEPQIVKQTSAGGRMDRNRRLLISSVRFHKHLIPNSRVTKFLFPAQQVR